MAQPTEPAYTASGLLIIFDLMGVLEKYFYIIKGFEGIHCSAVRIMICWQLSA